MQPSEPVVPSRTTLLLDFVVWILNFPSPLPLNSPSLFTHNHPLSFPNSSSWVSFTFNMSHFILVFLLQRILSMIYLHIAPRFCSFIPDLKGLYNRKSPTYQTISLIFFVQPQNHLIFLVLILLMDGSVSLLNIIIVSHMFVLLIPLKF